jgi:predicted 3-demethylubiquinone-9 3-methyltransferase (glyoxalase superfamily)
MEKIATMMWYDKDAEAAAEHYVKGIPNSKITGIDRYPAKSPGGSQGQVMLVHVLLDGKQFHLLNGGPMFTPNESHSTVIYADDQKETDFLWDHFSKGGKTSACGWVKDKWGHSWQITPKRFVELMTTGTPEVKARVFGAMMEMTKFDIAKIEAAAKG